MSISGTNTGTGIVVLDTTPGTVHGGGQAASLDAESLQVLANSGITQKKWANTIVGVDDSTGLDGFSISGPQTTYADNVAWWASAYSKGALEIGSTCSVGGWTTADVDEYWDDRVLGRTVKFVVLGIGLNNIYGATDATVAAVDGALRAWMERRAAEVKSWGGTPIIKTMIPVPSGYFAATTVKREAGFRHNNWRRKLARENGYILLDAETLVIDPTNADANPYQAYFQTDSPHPGKEILRTLGFNLWNNSLKYLTGAADEIEQATKHVANQVFDNPALTGVGGNLQGGAGTLPASVWGWQTGAHTTYAAEASTDSKLAFAGAPVKSNWAKVTTNIASIATAPNGTPFSADTPGLLFFSTGKNFSAGDVIRATVEIEVVTPNTLCGFVYSIQNNEGTSIFSTQTSSAFTPAVNADNVRNQILTPTVFKLPEMEITLAAPVVGGGVWLVITPRYSGITGGTGNAVWRVRNPRVWKVQ